MIEQQEKHKMKQEIKHTGSRLEILSQSGFHLNLTFISTADYFFQREIKVVSGYKTGVKLRRETGYFSGTEICKKKWY